MNAKITLLFLTLFIIQSAIAQQITIKEGSGLFTIHGSGSHKADSITVFYHKPVNFRRDSKILLVIPGAGRNGNDYRDSWVESSEKNSILIISPSYPEEQYNYGDYHLGGVVKDLDLSKGISFVEGTNQVRIDENIIEFNVNENKEDWIFGDFDRIFELVRKAVKSRQKKYDVFGHSAGGQILHRFALLHPNSKADRILASNAGTYTIPDYETDYPFGMKNIDIPVQMLNKSFKKNLVLFLGEQDNDSETRGRMLRSETADRQGTNRLDRGKYFYKMSEAFSKSSKLKFNWELEIVPNVGHDQKKMAEAAAHYLYGHK